MGTVTPGLKTIADAANIRRRIYVAFEAAEREADTEQRTALLTFVVVGGGPTGVELAGALSEIAKHTLKRDFRHINPEDSRILIVEAAPHVLAHYPEELSRRAVAKIRDLGIEVLTDTKVTEITPDHVRLATIDGETIVPSKTVLWGAGVQANPLGRKLAAAAGIETDRARARSGHQTAEPGGSSKRFRDRGHRIVSRRGRKTAARVGTSRDQARNIRCKLDLRSNQRPDNRQENRQCVQVP